MITLEAWSRNPEGTYDVTVVSAGERYTYHFQSQPIIHKLQELLHHRNYKCAAALISAFAIRSPGEADHRRHTPADGRKRPDPAGARAETGSALPGISPVETGWLFGGPDASPEIASADRRSVMLYPY